MNYWVFQGSLPFQYSYKWSDSIVTCIIQLLILHVVNVQPVLRKAIVMYNIIIILVEIHMCNSVQREVEHFVHMYVTATNNIILIIVLATVPVQ